MLPPKLDISVLQEISENFCGIYICLCLATGKYYLGSSINFSRRLKCHLSDLSLQKHDNGRVQNAWNKYGEKNFIWLKVKECKDANVTEIEQFYLDKYQPWNNQIGLNISKYADSVMRGRKHSEESKKKMSLSQIELRKRMPHPRLGMKHTEESNRKNSEAQKGRIRSPEERLKQKIYYQENGSPLRKKFKLISPNGEILEFIGVREFAKKYHMSNNTLSKILSGEIKEIRGWKPYKE